MAMLGCSRGVGRRGDCFLRQESCKCDVATFLLAPSSCCILFCRLSSRVPKAVITFSFSLPARGEDSAPCTDGYASLRTLRRLGCKTLLHGGPYCALPTDGPLLLTHPTMAERETEREGERERRH